jgi:hypothetical protein
MRMAVTTLRLLRELSSNPSVRPTFLLQPLLGRAAYGCLHFLVRCSSLCLSIGLPQRQESKFSVCPTLFTGTLSCLSTSTPPT